MKITKIEIDTGAGFVEFKPIHDNFELSKQRENNVRIRFKSSGNLRFVGTEFDTLNTLKESGINTLDIKIYVNYKLTCEGKLNLPTKNWDDDSKICELEVDIVDKYNNFLKNYDIEQNMFGQTGTHSAKIRIDSSINQIALPPFFGNQSEAKLAYNPDGTTNPPPSPESNNDWDIIGFPYSSLTNDAILSISDAGSGRINIESTGHGLIDSQYHLPIMTLYGMTVSSYNDTYNDIIVVDDDNFTVTGTWNGTATGDWKVAESSYFVYTFKYQYVNFPADGFTLGEYLKNWYLKTGFTASDAELEFDTWRLLYDIHKDLLGLADSSINITQTLGVNDYCKYFSVTDTDYNKLFIDLKSNLKDPTEFKGNAQYTEKRLLEVYKFLFDLDWRINDNNYLQFIHPSENVKTLPSFVTLPKHDFTAQSKALSKKEYTYSVDNFINSEIWKTEKLSSGFFSGYPIFYDNESTAKKEYSLSEFYNDLRQLSTNNINIQDEGYCIIATFVDGSDDIIWNVDTTINGKLGLYDLQKNILANGDRPFKSGEINNITETFTNTKNIRFKEIPQPLNDFDDLDFDYLAETDITNYLGIAGAQIDSIKQKFDGSFATIKISF